MRRIIEECMAARILAARRNYRSFGRIARRSLMPIGLLAIALALAVVAPAQSNAGTKPADAKEAAPAQTAAKTGDTHAAKLPPPGPHEVAKVHGYWVIEVRNPDGKVTKHMEFENQLCTSFSDGFTQATTLGGDSILSSLLAGTASAGAWSIVVGAPPSVPNPANCDIVPYAYVSQSGVNAFFEAYSYPPAGGLKQPFGIPASISCSLQTGSTDSAFETGGCIPVLVESPAPAGQVGISLSAQFTFTPGTTTISAVGTQLFTCTGSPGPPRPADCQNLGKYAANLYAQGTPCLVETNANGGLASPTIATWTGCIPGDPSTNTVTTTSFTVAADAGQNPFSGVALTGTGGVPGPFTVSSGQTVSINWTLTFQ